MTGLALLIAAALAPAPAAVPGRTYLASIAGIALTPDEYLDRFQIRTWGVEMLAVCHLPPGWYVRAGRSAAPDGDIEGEATHGVTYLNRARLAQLGGLALIRLDGPVQRRETRVGGSIHPATFAGQARIGRYGTDERRRTQSLGAANVRLVPATRCPPPR